MSLGVDFADLLTKWKSGVKPVHVFSGNDKPGSEFPSVILWYTEHTTDQGHLQFMEMKLKFNHTKWDMD